MNKIPARTCNATSERNVPVIRLTDDEKLREIYHFGRKLGHGSFGAVYEATHVELQTEWAIKVVHRPKPGTLRVQMVDNEINILKEINHAHIIHLEAIYNTAERIYFVTELCKGGDLKMLLQKKTFFTEDETRYIISCLADAVSYLHIRAIVHRDLKLENILVENIPDEDDGRVKIKVADFGLSTRMVDTGLKRMDSDDDDFWNVMKVACGTPIYMAPEMMKNHRTSRWCDMWSIGVIMFILLCGEPPFVSKTKKDLLEEIENKGVHFTQPTWTTVSDGAKHILSYLLHVEPGNRLSAPYLLHSSWIAGENSVPSGPTTMQEMIQQILENENGKQTLQVSSLKEDEPEPAETSTGPDIHNRKCGTHAKLSPGISPTSSRSMQLSDASEKWSTQQRRPQEKKDISTGQKQDSKATKAKDQTTSSSSKVGTTSVNRRPAVKPKNST